MDLKQAVDEWAEQECSQMLWHEKTCNETVVKMELSVAFLKRARVEVKKIGVSKKPPNRGSSHSSLTRRGLWGFPKVFITDGSTIIAAVHKYAVTPYVIEYDYSPTTPLQEFNPNFSKPALPTILVGKPFEVTGYSQYNTEPLGTWLENNCAELRELDARVRAEWDKQAAAFPAEVDRYIDKLGGRQRLNFQAKLVKELMKNRNELTGMSSEDMFKTFQFARDHFDAMSNLLNFCRRNQADAAFIDEGDFKAALDLAGVKELMDS
jgi:hypothetical protein